VKWLYVGGNAGTCMYSLLRYIIGIRYIGWDKEEREKSSSLMVERMALVHL
jgi:hypothetical protein